MKKLFLAIMAMGVMSVASANIVCQSNKPVTEKQCCKQSGKSCACGKQACCKELKKCTKGKKACCKQQKKNAKGMKA